MSGRIGASSGTRWIAVVVVCAVIVVAAAFVLGTFVKSPWETAIANSLREPLVTAPVEQRTLAADVVEASGVFAEGGELSVALPKSDTPGVVTARKVAVGDPVGSGRVLAEVSGRPVFALSTPFTLYRDLNPGVEGPDVTAVQEALQTLGYYTGAIDGRYGAGTSAAVSKWYESAGYAVLRDDALDGAVEAAQIALDDAREARDEAIKNADGALVGAADDADDVVMDAQRVLAEAIFAALPPLRAAEVARIPEVGAVVLAAVGVGEDLGSGADASGGGEPGSVAEIVRLRVGEPTLTARVGVSSKDAFGVGSAVEVRAVSDQRQVAPGSVTAMSEFREPDAETVGGLPGYDVTIVFNVPPPFTDGDTLVAASTEALAPRAEGMAVPLVALREDASGTYVTAVGHGKDQVTVVATGDGYAVVDADELTTDDEVVVSGTVGGAAPTDDGAER